MRPAAFDYHRAGSLPEAAALLARLGPDARILAGGQSLIPAMMLRLARPTALVDIGRLPGLRDWSFDGDRLRIGALATHAAIERSAELRARFPLLPAVAAHIGHPSIRNRGSIGGSLAHADPAAEWPAVLLACGGRVRAVSDRGERWIAAADFLQGFFATALRPDEVLAEIELPVPAAHDRYGFAEHARQSGAFAIALVVIRATLGEDRCLDAIRVVVGGCGPQPCLAVADADGFLGEPLSVAMAESIAQRAAAALDPQDDLQASAADRRQIVQTLVQRALAQSVGKVP